MIILLEIDLLHLQCGFRNDVFGTELPVARITRFPVLKKNKKKSKGPFVALRSCGYFLPVVFFYVLRPSDSQAEPANPFTLACLGTAPPKRRTN